MAGLLHTAPDAIATDLSTGNNAMPQCAYRVRTAQRTTVLVTVNVDNGPQPYFVLERTIVEASQIFSGQRLSPAPVAVPNLGLEASWFPEYDWLMATDGYRLITSTVDWRAARQRREIALARAMTATYLHTPHGKAAQALANGYPSG